MVALYDVAPKFQFAVPDASASSSSKIIEREFRFAGHRYRVTVKPIRVKVSGAGEEERYLGEREQLVEDVVRRFATKHGRLSLSHRHKSRSPDGMEIRATFTIGELRQELRRVHHTFGYNEIAEALMLLNQVPIVIEFLDVKRSPILSSPAFPVLAMRRKDDGDGETFVEFNPLVSEAIRLLDFDEVDYETLMKIRDPVARLLFKRLQAEVRVSGSPFLSLSASEVRRDIGMPEWKKRYRMFRRVQQSVETLVSCGVIEHLETETVRSGTSIADLNFSFSVSADFMCKIHASRRVRKENDAEFSRLSKGNKPSGFLSIGDSDLSRLKILRAQRLQSALEFTDD